MKQTLSGVLWYRQPSEVPFFCKPIPLFLCIWGMMLASFELHLSFNSYPNVIVALLLCALSIGSLTAGYLVARLLRAFRVTPSRSLPCFRVDLGRLRRLQMWLFAVSIAIVLMNLVAFGLPPLFAMLGATTLSYVEYGKLKQILNAATMTLTVSASLESSARRKLAIYAFSFFAMIAYATRGFLLVMLAQALFAFCLRTRLSKRSLYFVGTATLLSAALLSNFIGGGRSDSTQEAFVSFFGIRQQYAHWPMTTLWILSYVATPFSNLCWIIHSYHYTHPTLIFLATLLPAFWMPVLLDTTFLGNNAIIDGVHTYAAKYYLDLWFFGIVLINAVWGVISGALTLWQRLTRNTLTSSVLLAAIVFIFFADYLTMLSIVMELALLAWLERYAMLPQPLPPNQTVPAMVSVSAVSA